MAKAKATQGTRHVEGSRFIDGRADDVFAFVDDHAQFSSHMDQSSRMMGGGRMSIEVDDARGRAVGSHIRMSGRILGLRLFLDEVVTRRQPPTDKIWRTVGPLRLLVIGSYTMGVRVNAEPGGSRLHVFIDYALPRGWATRWLGRLFGGLYARWCVGQMLAGAEQHFLPQHAPATAGYR